MKCGTKTALAGVAALCIMTVACSHTQAAPVLYEPFQYSVGQKIIGSVNPGADRVWNDPSAPIQNATLDTHLITAGNVNGPGLTPASGNSLSIPRTPQSNISKIGFGTYFYNSTTETGNAPEGVFFSFTMKLADWVTVSDASAAAGQDGAFFAGFHWNTDGGSFSTPGLYAAQVRIRRELNASGVQTGKYQLGIVKNNQVVDNPVQYAWDTAHSYAVNEQVLIVGSYKFNSNENTTDDKAFLWVNPILDGPTPAPTVIAPSGYDTYDVRSGQFYNIKSFYFRSDSITPGQLIVDELRIGTSFADVTPTPEPTAGVFGIFALWAFGRRRV